MRKHLKIFGTLMMLLLCMTGCKSLTDAGIYEVILPDGYEESVADYPVLYILPQDGQYLDDSGMTEAFVNEMENDSLMDMIIVKPEFEKEANVIEEMKKIVASVESEYKVIKTKKHRILIGTGVGGYLAYTVGLAERDTFGVMASVRGDFSSEKNMWFETYGSVNDSIDEILRDDEGYFEEVYTYIDAPVDDAWTDMEESTNDLGAKFIEMGTSASAHEFTVRPGVYNDEYLNESVNRFSEHLTTNTLGETFTGTLKMNNANRMVEETFKTSATKKGKYLIYLPQDYYETEKYYPTMYLLHPFNSDHTSYETDGIEQVLDEGIESGLFDEMIVVIPNSSKESWWTGKWEKMLIEDLVPHIDKKYRTINDARYRMTAGCSMGGQGAFGVALTNPQCFSGVASFSGALNMAPTMEEDAILIAGKESKEYLEYFSYSFICGNQDSYGFGVPAIDLHQILAEKEVDHYFFIENGGHDSDFYLAYFNKCIGYVRKNMYQPDDAVEKLVKASANVDGTKVKVTFEALAGIESYFNQIPESSYTEEDSYALQIPLIIQIVKDGEVIHTKTVKNNTISKEKMGAEYEFDFAKKLKNVEDFEVVVKAAVFDKIVDCTR